MADRQPHDDLRRIQVAFSSSALPSPSAHSDASLEPPAPGPREARLTATHRSPGDATLCVAIAPVAVTPPYWLVWASMLDSRPAVDSFFRVHIPRKVMESAAGALPSELAVLACDFSRRREGERARESNQTGSILASPSRGCVARKRCNKAAARFETGSSRFRALALQSAMVPVGPQSRHVCARARAHVCACERARTLISGCA